MIGKGLITYEELLSIYDFINILVFKERICRGVTTKRAQNERYHLSDVMKMVIVGLIARAKSVEQISVICSG